VDTGPVVEACANCGAPLDLDEAGACRWCHARVRVRAEPAVFTASRIQDEVSLMPEDVDDCWSSSPFLYLALATFGLLSVQPEVQQYMQGEPLLLQQIRALITAVSAAGARVRDAGLLKNDFDENLEVYTPEEIWIFDLAFDVITLVGAVDGLSRQTRARVVGNMRSLNEKAQSHTWKKDMKKAGEGPAAWHELRARVPHRG
jgi:hypothetical protein